MTQQSKRRIAVLGAGKMGETLIRGLLSSGTVSVGDVVTTAGHEERIEKLGDELGIATTLDNAEAVRDAELVLLCVKPQMAETVLADVREALSERHMLISILASVTTGYIERRLRGEIPVVRAMPNTPTLIGAGMTVLCGGRWAAEEQLAVAGSLFAPLGRTLSLDERHMDAVTGLSASGPAFIYIVIEALAEGGVKVGLPRKVATELAAQTCYGAARMVIDTGSHPALLKDEVTTPAGCTIDGILKLEEGGLRVTLIKAIVEAEARAAQLVNDG